MLVLTLLCRNEADIIREHITYHLRQGVDFIIATDNGSIDGTYEILKGFEQTGRLLLLRKSEYIHDQSLWVTQMANIAMYDLNADWIIHSDADEFWMPAHYDLGTYFNQCPLPSSVLSVQRFNFLPPSVDIREDLHLPFHQLQVYREFTSFNSHGQTLPPKICHRSLPSVLISPGNHTLFSLDREYPSMSVSDLEILHFPCRSLRQFTTKIRYGAEALISNTNLPVNVGSTWRYIYSKFYLTHRMPFYYNSLAPNLQVLSSGLHSGALILDTRLRDLLHGS